MKFPSTNAWSCFFFNILCKCIEETRAHDLCPLHHFGKKATAKLEHERHMDVCRSEMLNQLDIPFASSKTGCAFGGCKPNHEELKAELIR